MTKRVGLVAVGVDNTGGALPTLAGAAKGALQMEDWLNGQKKFGIQPVIRTLVDTKGPVLLKDVQDAVADLVDNEALDLLILYFSGHGMLKAAFDEQVLLSQVKKYKHEAVAITPTFLNAAYAGIGHVVVISDACRSVIDPFGPLGTVVGTAAIDRGNVVGSMKGKVDIFYATEPSQTAKEFKGEGFFTRVLLDAFANPTSAVVDVWPNLPNGVSVVPTWKLETYLDTEVPVRASMQVPPFNQRPDFTVTSRQPQFLGYVDGPISPTAGHAGESLTQVERSSRRTTEFEQSTKSSALDELVKAMHFDTGFKAISPSVLKNAGMTREVDAYVNSAQGRQAFETRTGYTFVGEPIEIALLSYDRQIKPDPSSKGSQDLRLHPVPFSELWNEPEARGSVMVYFRGGTVCVLPVMPGYIGTIEVREGRVASLSYEVSSQLRKFLYETDQERAAFADRRAVAAALASSGKLNRLRSTEGHYYASFMRQSKRADPTLGIYAAYAYGLSGDEKGVKSVFRFFSEHMTLDREYSLAAAPIPFDVAMLADELKPDTALRRPGFAPFCPLMSLGWTVMSSFPGNSTLHDAITAASKHRLNSEWTTFRAQDIRPLMKAFERGEIL
jgi:hypothetical protein